MGAVIHCGDYSMRDLSEDSNSCNWSVHFGEKQIGSSSARPVEDTHSCNGRDYIKRTLLEQDAIFKNQVSELHRLYRAQRTLMEELRQKKLNVNLNQSEVTPENECTKQHMPCFLSRNHECGGRASLGSSSQDCSVPIKNGVSSKDPEVLEVRPLKVRRKMIDLQLPAEEYMDTDAIGDPHENLSYPPLEQSKLGKEVWKKQFIERGNASHQEDSSGTCLGLKKYNGFADLNEPIHCQELEPMDSSKDTCSLYRRNNGHVQGHCLVKDTSQNSWMVLEAGHDKRRLPPHPVQITVQPPSYPLSDQSRERTFCEMESYLRNPEVSYDSHLESSVASSVPSSHGHGPEFVQPWPHWHSSWDNPNNSSGQKFLPVQVNPFLTSNTQGRATASFEIWCRDLNGLCQGSSSAGPKETIFGFPPVNFNHFDNFSNGVILNGPFSGAVKLEGFERHRGPKKQENCPTGLSWLKPKHHYRSEITNGCLDLNASIHQITNNASDTGDDFTNVSPHKSLRSVSCSNNAGIGRVEMTVERDLDINMPCDAAVSDTDHHGAEVAFVDKEEGKRAVRFRHHIDLNICASEDEDSGLEVKRRAFPWIDLEAPATLDSEDEAEKSPKKRNEGVNFIDELKAAAEAIVAISISLSDHPSHPDEAASSSTDGTLNDPLAWFVDTIASCGDELEKRIEAFSEGREECSSGELDYFETMTLNLVETKEEDYMPQPLIPENLSFEGTGCTPVITNQPRRGQPRRGRPKRDFQRDILPGLTSLARHEVTEDIQMFGGLMKTTGYSWNSGAARKNSTRGRGRKRLVTNTNRVLSCPLLTQSMNDNIQVAGAEDRSFTGWGRATRRPRRQRCPAGFRFAEEEMNYAQDERYI